MDFPDSLPVAALEIKNSAYDAKRQAIAEALYYGGERFEAVKDQLLTVRSFEMQPGVGAQRMRQSRLRSSYYGAPVAGFIDFIAACVFQSCPTVLFDGPADRVAYYNKINDGLAPAMHSRLIQLILHGCAYMSLAESVESDGTMRPEVTCIDYCSVIDWDEGDGEGWIKTKSIDLVRANPWEQPSVERNTWTFITDEAIYEYVAEREIKDGKPVMWDKKAVGTLTKKMSVSGSPVTEIELPTEFCLMDSVAPLVVGLWNREASLDYALDASAFSFLALFTKKNLRKVMVSEMQGLVLNPDDKAEWLSPSNTAFEALANRAEAMRKQLENRIQSAALNLASRDTQGRASGIAKFRDFGPIAILLEFYGDVLKDGLEEHVEKLIALKGDADTVTFKVMGLSEFDIASLDTKLMLVSQFLSLPVGQTAKKWVKGDLEQAMLANAPAEVREQALDENEEAEVEPMPPQNPMPPAGAKEPDESMD